MDINELIRSGDKETIKQVYKENSNEVYNFAKSITNDHELALTATKQTFIKLFSDIQNGENPANIRSAVLKIAHDESCRLALPESEVVTSPLAEKDNIAKELEKLVGDAENDGVMGETRVISIPKEMLNNETEDEDTQSKPELKDGTNKENIKGRVLEETQYIPIQNDSPEDRDSQEEPVPTEERSSYRPSKRPEAYGIPQGQPDGRAGGFDDRRYADNGYRQREYDGYDDYDDEDDGIGPSTAVFVVCLIICILFILLLLWTVCGLLQAMEVIPDIDLGYSWFNEYIYDIFK